MSAQAVGELLRQQDERGAVAAPRKMPAATDHGQLHIVRRNEPLAKLGRKDHLTAEIKIRGGKSANGVRRRLSWLLLPWDCNHQR